MRILNGLHQPGRQNMYMSPQTTNMNKSARDIRTVAAFLQYVLSATTQSAISVSPKNTEMFKLYIPLCCSFHV